MTYTKEKIRDGKKYRYATKSVRLPDGTVKTIQKLIGKNENANKGLDAFFMAREKALFFKYALGRYRTNDIFSPEEFEKIENMRVDYRHLLRKLNKNQLKDVFDRFTANFTY